MTGLFTPKSTKAQTTSCRGYLSLITSLHHSTVALADLQITEVRQRVFRLTYGAYKAWQDFIVSALQVNNILFSIPLQALVELWESEAMKKPTLRVTKWLGDIPIEANCTACSDLSFKARLQLIGRPQRVPEFITEPIRRAFQSDSLARADDAIIRLHVLQDLTCPGIDTWQS